SPAILRPPVAASCRPARLLGQGAGRVLDLCAAPGGKTLQLAAAGWQVTALDASPTRLERLRANLERTGLAADVVCADVLQWAPPAAVDAILIDAPCSATGIFRRHPDVLYRVRPSVIAEMAALQRKILARAAGWLRPGGRMVYATCSLEPEEGEAQLEAFLAAHSDYTVVDVEAPLSVGKSTPYIRTLPSDLAENGRCDGFFIALLERNG
ncbi:RsmB/NOP family class I SAM-dependent RNA methyltransferase, partial [uncultured Sphingomonas sp.]|uniref:RsmB/NOP family class I SAM-dependent RNA methyltransferase n=1 Tax=uncultured Sphingomonas sp. TaxID=158754 RepID=UPI00262CFAE7